jgi:hypothetical protein
MLRTFPDVIPGFPIDAAAHFPTLRPAIAGIAFAVLGFGNGWC